MKYLIIEDNQKMISFIEEIICAKDDNFIKCSDVNEALSNYAKHLPDYVLLDIQIHNMDGLSVLKSIRSVFPSAQIIVITDYDTPSSRSAVMSAGALAFVSKENLFELKKYLQF